jgi:hypothetical protein
VSGLREGVEVRDAQDIARHIRRMALLVRGAELMPGPKGRKQAGSEQAGSEQEGREQAGLGPGWWVLAQGGVLDEGSFEAREAAREALLERVRRAGILVGENVWVWDLSGRAQLVLTTLPTLERARKLAQRLREKGLAIVVRREMPEGPTRR